MTKQEEVYNYYLEHPEVPIKKIAEKFGVKYRTVQHMLYVMRVKNGTVKKRERY